MAGRLRKAINHQRHTALQAAIKKAEESNWGETACEPESTPPYGHSGKLPYPQKLHRAKQSHRNTGTPMVPTSKQTGHIIKSSTKTSPDYEWTMMYKHCLWVRLFDKHDKLLFNHADPCGMHTSQMIHLCTKLVNHLNLISQTNELEVQQALGTLEGTIIAQLTPPPDGKVQYHAWNLQDTNNEYYDIGAIAIIKQNKDEVFEGQLIDDFINTTFQLQ